MSSHVFSKAVGCPDRVEEKEGMEREHKLWEMCSGEVLVNMGLSEQEMRGRLWLQAPSVGTAFWNWCDRQGWVV